MDCGRASRICAFGRRGRFRGARRSASFAELASSAGTPQIPGLHIVYLAPLGNPARGAVEEHHRCIRPKGPPGSARALAAAQAKNRRKRGVTLWVETDGTVYWSTPETAITTHGDGANRNDNNTSTIRRPTAR